MNAYYKCGDCTAISKKRLDVSTLNVIYSGGIALEREKLLSTCLTCLNQLISSLIRTLKACISTKQRITFKTSSAR